MQRPKFSLRNLIILLCAIGLLGVCGLVTWIVYLDRMVNREFQGRLWSVPARVYAAPIDLYVGAAMSADDLDDELKRLHYRSADPANGPGNYRRKGGTFEVHTRRFQFADELREPERLVIQTLENSITGLAHPDGSDVPVFRLDPLLIGNVSPIHGEDRIVLAPADVPPIVRSAIKIIEDRRFDEHHGVDPKGILRALWANMRAGHVTQGGSTLTQQLVKNYFLSDVQTFGRKATEAVMALRLEARFSKEDILVAYLNEVYLGQDGERAIHGFGLGSEYFFAKPLSELDIGELAILVGLVKGPSYYDPFKHPERAKIRRNLVLQELATNGLIDADSAQKAMRKPLGLRPTGGSYVPAYLDLVRRHLKRDYAEADLAAAGLSIYTTLDPKAQAAAERALSNQLKRLDAAHPKNGHLQGAIIIAEPNSGDVVAVVGGKDAGGSGFNHALDAHRPIGSLVKPAVYLAAIESGRYHAASILTDAPIDLKLSDGNVWSPQNYTRETYGQVPMARALAESMNLATVRLGLDVGLDKVADTIQSLGYTQRPALNPSMLLGTVEMTPLEVVQMYTSLANGGFRARLRAVHAVLDEHGKPLKSFKVEVEEAAPAVAVYQVNRMLTLVTTHGTGRAATAHLPAGTVVAAKTGTSSDTRDSWFAGFTGSYLAVVWVGYDDNRITGLTGALGALPAWSEAISSLKQASFDPVEPEGLEDRWIEFTTGADTTPACVDAVSVPIPHGMSVLNKPVCRPSAAEGSTGKMKEWHKTHSH
jgi:penicillin-binding protein 1B